MRDLREDILDGAIWAVKAFKILDIDLDYSIQSIQHIDLALDEQFNDGQPEPNGLFEYGLDSKLFSLASYIGEVILEHTEGTAWVWDSDHVDDKASVGIRSEHGIMIWPQRQLLKCIQSGHKDRLYPYVQDMIKTVQESTPPPPKIEAIGKRPWWMFWND